MQIKKRFNEDLKRVNEGPKILKNQIEGLKGDEWGHEKASSLLRFQHIFIIPLIANKKGSGTTTVVNIEGFFYIDDRGGS
ncbi:hypothetical protein NLX69_09750 [Rossellomorea sp. BNER]|nr:hypothetical protein [Rossellomorea sp. BNER]